MDLSTFLTGGALVGAVVGLLAGFGNRIKSGITFLFSTCVETASIDDPHLCQVLLDYLVANNKRSGLYQRHFFSRYVYSFEEGRLSRPLAFEAVGHSTILFWVGWWPIILVRDEKKQQQESNSSSSNKPSKGGEFVPIEGPTMKIRLLRSTIDLPKLLHDANERHHQLSVQLRFGDSAPAQPGSISPSRFFITHCRSDRSERSNHNNNTNSAAINTLIAGGQPYCANHGDWPSAPYVKHLLKSKSVTSHLRVDRDNLSRLYFPDNVKELIEEMGFWLTTREWHNDKKLPWKRGWLLHGKPGVGKTALIRALAQDHDLPVFVFELAGMSNYEFIEHWNKMKNFTPCIVLLEDFDNVFHGRTNVTAPKPVISPQRSKNDPFGEDDDRDLSNGYLTFDTLLNMMDGIEQMDGVFTIVTTNKLEHIDPALGVPSSSTTKNDLLSTRPGRIDRAVELTFMAPEHMELMANRILSEFPEARDGLVARIPELLIDGHSCITPAQWQEVCSSTAIQWKFKAAKEAVKAS
jgi:hypothetical protein